MSESNLYLVLPDRLYDACKSNVPGVQVVHGNTVDEPPGWYFPDECEQLNGPFSTYEACLKAAMAYEP